MAALWLKTSLLLFLLILMPFSYGMVIDGFEDGMQTKYKLDKGGVFQINSARKLLMLNPNEMLDYDDAGANSKHDPIKKRPGKP